ncbi:MAG: hypothetical protein U9R02_07565 [Thermodesulfobacteriota bacterium]|nr:hypothetical protein [Thermodesulfobacteriota bacterium]
MTLPIVGVGLLYHYGYFRQFLDKDGCQQEEYPETDLYNIPLEGAGKGGFRLCGGKGGKNLPCAGSSCKSL